MSCRVPLAPSAPTPPPHRLTAPTLSPPPRPPSLQAGAAWRSWHLSYKAAVDDYYKEYEAKQKTKQ
ncbi:unnamed protein product [Chondrus crispus]|uniref:Uncharacterized protein n=1 Tax=Chondrus crispus TaxID=2769 RepID=R7Q952_CHOCR|nr:unnamed protein product [Chondrus crispus]CDF35047.1 unnamed protein product [Chondrus crispus]|eukprot:XP_005714866.1 unnamed protein product [Chondrus crispus]